jgi:3-methyladenine DNA glycosylase Mpg
VDFVDEVLVRSAISCDQAKVIRVRQGHKITLTNSVTFVGISLQLLKNRIKHKQKDHRAERIPLKNPTFEFECICSPRLGVHNRQAM